MKNFSVFICLLNFQITFTIFHAPSLLELATTSATVKLIQDAREWKNQNPKINKTVENYFIEQINKNNIPIEIAVKISWFSCTDIRSHFAKASNSIAIAKQMIEISKFKEYISTFNDLILYYKSINYYSSRHENDFKGCGDLIGWKKPPENYTSKFYQYLNKGNKKEIQDMINRGFCPYKFLKNKFSHEYSYFICKLYEEQGKCFDLNKKFAKTGNTLLHEYLANKKYDDYSTAFAITKLLATYDLMNYKSHLYAVNNNNQIPLAVACGITQQTKRKSISILLGNYLKNIKALKDYGFSGQQLLVVAFCSSDEIGWSKKILKLCKKENIPLNVDEFTFKDLNYPLIYYCVGRAQCVETLQLICSLNPNFNVRDDEGQTPLEFAKKLGRDNFVQELKKFYPDEQLVPQTNYFQKICTIV